MCNKKILLIELPRNFIYIPYRFFKKIDNMLLKNDTTGYASSFELKTLSRTGVEISGMFGEEYDVEHIDFDAILIKKFGNICNFPKEISDLDLSQGDFDIDLIGDDLKLFLEQLTFNESEYDYIFASMTKIGREHHFEMQIRLDLKILKYLKNKFISSKIILGGGPCSYFKNDVRFVDNHPSYKKSPFIDVIWDGTLCEKGFSLIVDDCEEAIKFNNIPYNKNKNNNFPPSPYKNNRILVNDSDLSYNYDEIFDFYKVPNPDKSINKKIKIADIAITSGCPGRCTFCTESSTTLKLMNFSYFSDVTMGYIDKGYNSFRILSDCINPIADKFCNWISQKNIKIYWACDTRHSNDPDYFKMLYDGGCRRLHFGTETVDNKILKYIDKGFTNEQMVESLRLSNEAGIWNICSFISNLPYSKSTDYLEIGEFVKNNKDLIQFIYVNNFRLIAGSLFFMHPERYDIKVLNIEMRSIIGEYIWKETKRKSYSETLKNKLIYPPQLEGTNVSIDVSLHLLFTLYDILGDKSKVYSWFDDYYFPRVKKEVF